MNEFLKKQISIMKEDKSSYIYQMFLKDFERAMSFYNAAKTNGKTIPGEYERRADRYAEILITKYLHAGEYFASNKTGMQKLAILSNALKAS